MEKWRNVWDNSNTSATSDPAMMDENSLEKY
jgi:hypothetical protein